MRRRRISYDTLISQTIKAWMPSVARMYAAERPSWVELFADYEGRPGPATFEGTPAEVIRQLRRYQKGLS